MTHNPNLPPNLNPIPRPGDAWADAQARRDQGLSPQPDPSLLAYADPEFLNRRETRGVRLQLELMKPDLQMQAHGIVNTIVVFGSARIRDAASMKAQLDDANARGDAEAATRLKRLQRGVHYYEQAQAFGRLVALYSQDKPPADQLFVCTGGGPGIMQAANQGAHEAGGRSVGLAITLPHEEKPNDYVTPELSFRFHYFAIRKMHFMMRAKALVAFPGGFGTLDELFEVMTLVQTGKSQRVPIVLFGSDYWKRLINFDVLVDEGMISPQDVQLVEYVDTPEGAWDAIQRYYAL